MNFNVVSPFKRLCITIGNLPTAYLESMSYYEGLTYLVNYLANNVIPAVNNNGEAVNELQEKFIELKNYVDTYFDNLDVQEEINNKLDEMVSEGELASIILDYLDLGPLVMVDTLSDLQAISHIVEGSYIEMAGSLSYNDGKRALYRVRALSESDVIDEDELVSLTNFPTLVAEKLINYRLNEIENDISTIEGNISDITSDIGDLDNLTTSEKTNLVGAINEENSNIGDLDTLSTTEKSSVVGAINEVNQFSKFNFNVTYQARRVSTDSDTPQITLGKFSPSTATFTQTSSGMSNAYCNILGATNSEGSIGKIYGPIRMTVNYTMNDTNGYPCIRLRCADFGINVPDESYVIWSACNCYCNGYFGNGSIYVGSDGYLYLFPNMNLTASNNEMDIVYNPCIYIWSNLGDTPEE